MGIKQIVCQENFPGRKFWTPPPPTYIRAHRFPCKWQCHKTDWLAQLVSGISLGLCWLYNQFFGVLLSKLLSHFLLIFWKYGFKKERLFQALCKYFPCLKLAATQLPPVVYLRWAFQGLSPNCLAPELHLEKLEYFRMCDAHCPPHLWSYVCFILHSLMVILRSGASTELKLSSAPHTQTHISLFNLSTPSSTFLGKVGHRLSCRHLLNTVLLWFLMCLCILSPLLSCLEPSFWGREALKSRQTDRL